MHDMIPVSRRDVIESRLQSGQSVTAAALASEFQMSEDAIRRDLRALAAEGKCRKVYGGALPVRAAPSPIGERLDLGVARKQALARAAVEFIGRGELLFLDCGSTNLALANLLPSDRGLTAATNSIDIAAALLKRGDIPFILIGGVVSGSVGGSVDASAVAAAGQMTFDRTFVGVCAVDQTGISVHEHADAIFKRAVLARSRAALALVISEKLGEQAPFAIGGADAVRKLVLERDASDAEERALAGAGHEIFRAGEI